MLALANVFHCPYSIINTCYDTNYDNSRVIFIWWAYVFLCNIQMRSPWVTYILEHMRFSFFNYDVDVLFLWTLCVYVCVWVHVHACDCWLRRIVVDHTVMVDSMIQQTFYEYPNISLIKLNVKIALLEFILSIMARCRQLLFRFSNKS